MKPFNPFFTAVWLSLSTFSLVQAGLLASRATSVTPTRPFTVSAFESPYPVGQGLTGYNLTARNGNLYLSPKANVQKAVLFVTGDGRAYLDSENTPSVYVDTYSGLLAYASPAPVGAMFVDFVHRGHGTQVFYQGNGFTSDAPGTFQWIGAGLTLDWQACSTSGGEYQVYQAVSIYGGTPDTNACTGIELSALDYS